MDVITIPVPKKLVEEARKRGLDVEELVLQTLVKILGVDPRDVQIARLELAKKMLKEGEEHLIRGDAVQASEKIYKAVEECIKALAEKYRVKVLDEVMRRGKWETWLLGKAARELGEKLGEDRIRLVWKDAYDIHVWGFHERKYDVEDVKPILPLAKWLLEYAEKLLTGKNR